MEAQTLPYETFEEIYSRQLENDCYICLVYEINGEVIGCINLRMEYQLHHAGRICEIMELAVRYNEAKAQGCLQIEVCCNQLRLRTHRFYEVCGMHNFHYKFSLSLTQTGDYDNKLGR